jgi:hypothetical protein
MLVRVFGALCGAWRFDEAFAADLFDDVPKMLDRALARGAETPRVHAQRDAA